VSRSLQGLSCDQQAALAEVRGVSQVDAVGRAGPIPEGVLRDVDAVVVNTKELASKSSSVKKGGLDI
jgi:hypothetical protein